MEKEKSNYESLLEVIDKINENLKKANENLQAILTQKGGE